MPIAWVDVPDPKNPPAGAPKLSAANLARLALIEDIGTPGTPTGDALKAAYGAVVKGPTLPAVPPGEYIWFKTDGNGTVLDILSGVQS